MMIDSILPAPSPIVKASSIAEISSLLNFQSMCSANVSSTSPDSSTNEAKYAGECLMFTIGSMMNCCSSLPSSCLPDTVNPPVSWSAAAITKVSPSSLAKSIAAWNASS